MVCDFFCSFLFGRIQCLSMGKDSICQVVVCCTLFVCFGEILLLRGQASLIGEMVS